MTYTKLITLLVFAIGMVQTADAGLQWVAIGNQPNANNTNAVSGTQNTNDNGADTGEFTIGVIPDANQLAAVPANTLLNDIGQFTINMSFDLIGAADGGMFDITATSLVPGLPTFNGAGASLVNQADGVDITYIQFPAILAPNAPTLDGLQGTADANGVIPLMRLVVELPTGTFNDGAANPFSQIELTLEAGSDPTQTQLGEIGSLDNPQNTDPLFDATPTANPDSPNFGVAGDTHVLQVGTAPAVPEPSSFLCLSMIVFATGGARWYRKRQAVAVSEEA